jgi:hypothetical protein
MSGDVEFRSVVETEFIEQLYLGRTFIMGTVLLASLDSTRHYPLKRFGCCANIKAFIVSGSVVTRNIAAVLAQAIPSRSKQNGSYL